jgi:hypothetical protein
MDRDRFDTLARLLATSGSRRVTLGILLGVLVGPTAAEAARKRRKDRSKDDGRDRDQGRSRDQALQSEGRGKKRRKKKKKRGGSGHSQPSPPPDCCGTKQCADPEPGSTSAGCDYAGRSFAGQDHNGSLFRGIDGREANFIGTDNRGSVFAEACLQGARFRRARLGGSTWGDACLFGADFTGADFGGDLTLFDDARFCGTRMPDDSVNDRDCNRATACCRAELGGGDPCQDAADCADQPCQTKTCQNGQCAYTPVIDGPDPGGECGANASGHCCEGVCCDLGATECNPLGLCCVPNCTGRQCGPDGCGGSCGTCPAGQPCSEDGRCPCTPQSCPNGCCDEDGNCQPGNTLQSCGTGGEACEPCNDQRICQDGQCVNCSPNCICQGQDFCTDPGAPNTVCFEDDVAERQCFCLVSRAGEPFCGNGSLTPSDCTTDVDCQSVAPGAFCVDAAPTAPLCVTDSNFCVPPCCTPQSCPDGCCDNVGGGNCQPGNTLQACGTGGEICQSCGDDEICQNGRCVTCSPTCTCMGQSACSAAGDNIVCFEHDDGTVCFCLVSRSGQPFCSGTQQDPGNNCQTDEDCQEFAPGAVCVNAGPANSLCPSGNNFCAAPCCTPESCPDGCCFSGFCVPGITTEACGRGGGLCVECGPDQACQNGQCTG